MLFLLLLACGGSFVYWQAQQRVVAATAALTEDIGASHDLLHQAAGQQDAELFSTLIAGGDPGWVQAQRALLAEGLLFDRWPLGLRLQAAGPEVQAIVAAPDLNRAEVRATREYAVDRADGVEERVTLQHVITYQRGQNRWLAGPPPPGFWGEWQVADGRFFTLVYPERDGDIAGRLLADLETQLIKMCHTLPDVACTSELRLLVRLDQDPAALATLADASAMLSGRPSLRLPAPTLVGRPLDEAGYQALLRGYAAHVVAAVLIQNSGWSCCKQGLFHQALLDQQLAQLGLRPWPLTPAIYAGLPGQAIAGLPGLNQFWSEPPAMPLSGHAWPQVYALVDFLLQTNPDVSAASMQRHLVANSSYFSWLQRYIRLGVVGNIRQQRAWLRFIQAQIETGPAPIPLPDQDIQLLCRSRVRRQATLYRYDLAAGTWMPELSDRPFLFMAPLPYGDGLLLQERQARPEQSQLLVWQDGQAVDVFPQPLRMVLFRADPVDKWLLLYTFDFSQRSVAYSLLDPADCGEGGCRYQELPGAPVWSPDGRRTLLTGEEGTLWLGNGQGQAAVEVGQGTAPFWLDNENYGYAHLAATPARPPAEIVSVSAATGAMTTLLQMADLRAAVPAGVNFDRLTVQAIAVSPADANYVFIAMTPTGSDLAAGVGALIFSYDRQTGAVSLALRLDHYLGLLDPLLFSPDGRWLAVQSFDRPKSGWQLHLYEVATGRTHIWASDYIYTFPGYAWSADGRWLLRVEDGFLHVLAPDYGYEQMIVHDFPTCSFAAWINKP